VVDAALSDNSVGVRQNGMDVAFRGATWYFTPSLRASSLQLGGKMEETRTRFWAAMPASRNAS